MRVVKKTRSSQMEHGQIPNTNDWAPGGFIEQARKGCTPRSPWSALKEVCGEKSNGTGAIIKLASRLSSLVKKIAPVPFSVSSMDSFHVIHLALSFAWLTASVAPVKAEQPPGADCQSPQPGQIVFDKEVGPGARLVVTSVQTKAAGPMTAVPPGNDAKFRFTYVLARSGASLAVRTVDETQVIPGEVSDVVYKVLDAKLEGNILFILFWQTRRTALVVVNVDKPPPNNGEMLDFLMSDDDVRRQVRRGTISGSARDGTLKVRIERSRQSGPDEVVNYALRWRWGLPDLVRTDSPVSRRAK